MLKPASADKAGIIRRQDGMVACQNETLCGERYVVEAEKKKNVKENRESRKRHQRRKAEKEENG